MMAIQLPVHAIDVVMTFDKETAKYAQTWMLNLKLLHGHTRSGISEQGRAERQRVNGERGEGYRKMAPDDTVQDMTLHMSPV